MAERGEGGNKGEGKRTKPKKARDQWTPRKDGWTGAKRTIFLDTLAATCVARWAAKAAGMSYSAAAALRRRDPAFAARWRQAVTDSYCTVESLLIERSVLDGAPDPQESEPSDVPDAAKMNTELALKLLQLRQRPMLGTPHKGGSEPKRATEAETDASILRKLAALRKRLGRTPGEGDW